MKKTILKIILLGLLGLFGIASFFVLKSKDAQEAAKLYRIACNGGEMNGCNNLGVMYVNGTGVVQDVQEAVRFYRTACDGGEMSGCYNLEILCGSQPNIRGCPN